MTNSHNTKYIPYQEIINHLPVEAGDTLIIASDIIKIAFLAKRKEGSFDVNSLINSIQQKLTQEGTILIPSYNHNLISGQSFDIRKTKPITGALALAALNRDDFTRSRHPVHSFLVWGKNSQFYTSLDNVSSFGPDSPFAYFSQQNAKMLCIATRLADAFTYTHYVEECEKVNYRMIKKLVLNYTDNSGLTTNRNFTVYAKKRGWNFNLESLEERMKKEHYLSEYEMNNQLFQLITFSGSYDTISGVIKSGKRSRPAYFDIRLYVKELLKDYLYNLKLYRSTADKIKYA